MTLNKQKMYLEDIFLSRLDNDVEFMELGEVSNIDNYMCRNQCNQSSW